MSSDFCVNFCTRLRYPGFVKAIGLLFILVALPPVSLTAQTLTANGRSLPLTLANDDTLELAISYSGEASSTSHDWWLALTSSLPAPYHLLFFNGENWASAQVPVYQQPLQTLAQDTVLAISGIPSGTFTFYFGVEDNADGVLDIDALRYDSITLTVNSGGEFSPASCGAEQQVFDTSPLEEDAFFEIDPLGATNPSGHTFPTVHTYMMLSDKQTARTVYSPGHIQVFEVSAVENLTSGGTDFTMHFRPCDEVSAYFDHMSSLDQRLVDVLEGEGNCQQYVAGTDEYRFCTYYIDVNYQAGEVLGTVGGGTGLISAALDFGLRDTRITPLVYVNPGRLVNPDQLYVACPYDYFVAGGVFDTFRLKLMNARTDAPVCGNVDKDIAATAQGRWYLQGTSDFGENDHIALVPSSRAPDSTGVLSIGNATVGTDSYYFTFAESGLVNRRFADIAPDGVVYCFDTLRSRPEVSLNSHSLEGVLLLALDSESTLRLERSTTLSECPASGSATFSSAAVSFER